MSHSFWNTPLEKRRRPKAAARSDQPGLFDIRKYSNIDVVLGA
jgi:hypothetical protein